jgi:hypothetical protein
MWSVHALSLRLSEIGPNRDALVDLRNARARAKVRRDGFPRDLSRARTGKKE